MGDGLPHRDPVAPLGFGSCGGAVMLLRAALCGADTTDAARRGSIDQNRKPLWIPTTQLLPLF
jgi:hypothetical protein